MIRRQSICCCAVHSPAHGNRAACMHKQAGKLWQVMVLAEADYFAPQSATVAAMEQAHAQASPATLHAPDPKPCISAGQ